MAALLAQHGACYMAMVPAVDSTSDGERRARLAFAIRSAMAGRTAQQVAEAMDPPRSRETVARWARGETVPSALDVGPLARALNVRVEPLAFPPDVPTYPLADYLVSDALASGAEEGRRRSGTPAPPGRGYARSVTSATSSRRRSRTRMTADGSG